MPLGIDAVSGTFGIRRTSAPFIDLSHLEEIMPVVDALDSGQISREQFIEDGQFYNLPVPSRFESQYICTMFSIVFNRV